jgi:hypothetical protein
MASRNADVQRISLNRQCELPFMTLHQRFTSKSTVSLPFFPLQKHSAKHAIWTDFNINVLISRYILKQC